ncbi:ACP S-malonyltransferase, partial [Actinocorallia lasiicapitis]
AGMVTTREFITMAVVIGLPAARVEELCAAAATELGGTVAPANYNEPEQTVISGADKPVARAMELAAEAGARVVPLKVAAPFHCGLMAPLEAEFGAALADVEIRDPRLPVIANVTGAPVTTAAQVRDALLRQVAGPVRWTATMRELAGHDLFVECGPGRALSGFTMKIHPEIPVHSLGQERRLRRFLEQPIP